MMKLNWHLTGQLGAGSDFIMAPNLSHMHFQCIVAHPGAGSHGLENLNAPIALPQIHAEKYIKV